MPIVNGNYVPQTLGPSEQAQQNVFGEYSKKDMSDFTSAAYNYLMKQQEQAYNLELMKYTNEYNSPTAQMQRYQDAGLNPNLIYSQQTNSVNPSYASAPTFRSAGTSARQVQAASSMINSFGAIVKQAKDIWDYAKYGAEGHRLQNLTEFYKGALTKSQADIAGINALFENWLLGSPDSDDYSNTRRGLMYDANYRLRLSQIDENMANYDRIVALTKMIPDQKARLAALTALDEYRLQILRGQNDAVLNITTGNEMADAFLKAFVYFGMSKI